VTVRAHAGTRLSRPARSGAGVAAGGPAETPSTPARTFLAQLSVELLLGGGLGSGIGALVGVAAGVLEREGLVGPLIAIGALTGFTVGVLAVVTGREILPRLQAFPLPVRGSLMFLSLAGGAFAATGLGFWIYPWFALHSYRSVLLVGSINGLLALVAGSVVFLYEDLARRLARTREMLAAERLEQAHARERAARAELKALQARINPHFFFNALNTAAAFVTEDPERAERLLERFAELFRYAFRKGREESVPLDEEIEFIRNFLEIERARFGDRLKTDVRVEREVAAVRIPPLILQPLVENAVLHGRDPETGAGAIRVTARARGGGGLIIEIEDRGAGPGAAAESLPRGHALENIAARLAATRGGSLTIEPGGGGRGTCARLVFPGTSEQSHEEQLP